MDSQKHVVLVSGHSFVKGYKLFLENKLKVIHEHEPVETFAAQYLRVSSRVDQIYFEGDSGACIMDDFRLPCFKLRNLKPAVYILDIASNDIALGFSTDSICAALVDTSQILINKYGVRHVKICSCLRRERKLGQL